MNTIISYLENMFAGLPKTAEVLRAKKDLTEMMGDKYQELKNSGKTENEAVGIVISEFGNLEELAETLGISDALNQRSMPLITLDYAKAYIEASGEVAPKIALGVWLCIMSPVLLIGLFGLVEGFIDFKEEYALILGLTTLLLLVAAGVYILIRYSVGMEKYERLKKELFELDYQAEHMVREIKKQEEPVYRRAVSFSVSAYILSALPILLASFIFQEGGMTVLALIITITIVACSTYNIIKNNGLYEACKVLLQEEDYAADKKSGVLKAVSSIYWAVATALYLGYSFITGRWDISWILWPVAGVLFIAVGAITSLVEKKASI
ncbi:MULTISPECIES: permease prefix domain 1-containing protein [unclassified Sedimentibacter]|uniref:permease prefix domain 1-containing protein n=1 Tax=unclassified Sedimentibacter TaxID=2649220 RepID=UPI0027DEE2F9|nr:permease prefix domain 1-containing protein [Sedimentibacter sp. MB35-C1]WMJ78235.1 permease prefix domain 1-containing protein [Sedimentibacter sp. MB35-C1]